MKKITSVYLDQQDLIDAHQFGFNVSAICDAALNQAVIEGNWKQKISKLHEEILRRNNFIEQKGLFNEYLIFEEEWKNKQKPNPSPVI